MKHIKYADCQVFVPYYDSNSKNSTYAILSDNTIKYLDIPISTLVYKMHADFCLSHTASNIWSSTFIPSKKYFPLTLNEHMAYVPVRMRRDATHGHGYYGYVSLFSIADIVGSSIHLTNGTILSTESTYAELTKKRQESVVLLLVYLLTRGDLYRSLPPHIEQLLNILTPVH